LRADGGGTRRVVVIGAGVVGLCVAWYARAAGLDVVVVESGAPDRDCCSLGNAGLIVPSHVVPLSAPGASWIALRSLFDRRSPLRVRPRLDRSFLAWCWRFWRSATQAHVERSGPALRDIALLSRSCFQLLGRQLGDTFDLCMRGLRVLCRTHEGLEEEACAARFAAGLGIPAEIMDAAGTANAEPGLQMSIAGSVFYPLDAHLAPMKLLAALQERLTGGSATIRWHTPAMGWRTDSNRIRAVQTSAGDIEGDEFVLAAGAWSEQLARPLGLRIRLQAGKGYSVTLPRPCARPASSLILSEARIAVTPMADCVRFAGTLELAGLDKRVSALRLAAMLQSISRYLPAFDTTTLSAATPWAGLRPCSPDGLPYIGRTRRYDNLSICTGHAMMGVSLAPASGLLISEILADRRPAVALAPFDPDRFA